MKLKLAITLVIVLSVSCSRKTFQNEDYAYYKREMEKYKRQSTNKEASPEKTVNITKKPPVKKYLTAEEKKKFAQLLGVDEESIRNEKLYAAIKEWLGTPYDWGGESKNGVDCSAYVQAIYRKVYGNELPRTSVQQFYFDTDSHFKNQKYLKEGDLVFFRLRNEDRVVSHVGIYLQNGKFTGSNSPRGVEIVDINDPYWQDKYVASARLLNMN
ncbi:C40 family peptidase [Pseudozobellia thermophila]|nr:C40 family peptidase [Pseudozobellia thermophila]